MMNVDWAPGGCQPSDQANRLGQWVHRQLAATIHIHIHHWYYYSAHRLILILPSYRQRKAESTLGTAVRMCSPCPRLYITAAVTINTATRCVIPTLVLSHRSQMTEPLGHCNLHKLHIYWHVCNKSHLLAFNMMLTTFADKFGRCIPAIEWYLLQEPALHSKAAAAVDWQDRQMDTHPTVRDPAQQTIFWQHQ